MTVPLEDLVPSKSNSSSKNFIDFQLGKNEQKQKVATVDKKSPVSFPIGPGLMNLGNTCFMNSVLQCLLYTAPLRQEFLRLEHQKFCKREKFCSVCALQNLFFKCSKQKNPVSPSHIANNLRSIARHFRLGRQEDSHEFLRFLVDQMHETLKGGKSNKTSLIQKMFGGTFANEVKCCFCSKVSTKLDPMMDLSLDIKNCSSVEQALFKFIAAEKLCKENQYRCEK